METSKGKNHKLQWLYFKRDGSAKESKPEPSQTLQVPETTSPETNRTNLHRRINFRMRTEIESLQDSVKHSQHYRHELSQMEKDLSKAQYDLNMKFVKACRKEDYKEATEIMQNNKVDVKFQDLSEMGPIHYAAWHGRQDFLKMLLDKGVDPNCKGFEGRAPLHFAAMLDHRDCVEILLKGGAHVEQTDDYNWTPLHYASASDSPSAIGPLLRADADPMRQDEYGFAPVDLAASEEVDKLLPRDKSYRRKSFSSSATHNSSIYFTRSKQEAMKRLKERRDKGRINEDKQTRPQLPEEQNPDSQLLPSTDSTHSIHRHRYPFFYFSMNNY